MLTPLLLLFLGLQQDPAAQEALSRADRALQEAQTAQRQVADLKQLLVDELKPTCSSVVRWQASGTLRVLDPQVPVVVDLISMVSAPREGCLNAEIRFTANYYDENGFFLCSGSTSVGQSDFVQNTHLEFRPHQLDYFAKWRDGPTWEQSNFHRLICVDYDGIEVRDPASRATRLRLYATVLPKRGGLATEELQIDLPRVSRAPVPLQSPIGRPPF